MITIGTEPAGRLRNVLEAFINSDGELSLGEWWGHVSPLLATGGDRFSVRAEAAKLLRDVEVAIQTLPIDDNQVQYSDMREAWGRPIFGHGLNDSLSQRYTGAALVDRPAFNMLSSLSSILRRDSPEFAPLVSPEEIVEKLDQIYDKLGNLLIECQNSTEIPTAQRARIISTLTTTMEDVTFVRFRGLSRLVLDSINTEGELTQAAHLAETIDPKGSFAVRAASWVRTIKDIVTNLEQITVPALTFATVNVFHPAVAS